MSLVGRCSVVLLGLLMCTWHGHAQGTPIARLSAADGDVRVTRGERDEQAVGPGAEATAWEVAAVGMKLEPGFSLATGAGRAEIAFADGSRMDLGENSLMSFASLGWKGEAVRGPVDLVSGTLLLEVHPGRNGWYRVTTPTDQMVVRYPEHARMRVDSYLDGMALMGFEAGTVQVGRSMVTGVPGEELLFRKGKRDAAAVPKTAERADWEAWVPARAAGQSAGSTEVGATAQPGALTPARPPRICPRTVAQASLPAVTGAQMLGFDRRRQVFTLAIEAPRVATGSQIGTSYNSNMPMDRPGQPVAIGGGPSAIREGKGGSLGREGHPASEGGSIGPYQSRDPELVAIPH